MKSIKHPNGNHAISFNAKYHSYIDNYGQKYTSVTKFVSHFFDKFDADKMAVKCSKKEGKYFGMNPDDIKKQWLKKGEESRTEGTNIHEYAEYLFLQKGLKPKPVSERADRLFKIVEKAVDKLKFRFRFIDAELIVFNPDLKIAGTIDLLMFDEVKREIIILDWKQNETISKDNLYQHGLEPIANLDDSNFNHYALQLSLYRYILEQGEYYAYEYRQALIHIMEDRYKAMPVPYLKSEIERMIETWNNNK